MTRGFSLGVSLISALAVLLSAVPAALAAQTRDLPNGAAVGGSIDRFIYDGEGITAVSFRVSDLRARTMGSEIGVALFPDALSVGALFLAPDLGAAFNASGPGVTVLMKGGLSTLVAIGNGFAFAPGYHLGGGLIVQAEKRFGIRVDVIRHVYLVDNAAEGVWSVGLGFSVLPLSRALTEIQDP
jgi:hypothetical protein